MKSNRRLRKVLLFTAVFALNIGFGHFTIELFNGNRSTMDHSSEHKSSDGSPLYDLRNNIPDEYRSVVEKGHLTVLK